MRELAGGHVQDAHALVYREVGSFCARWRARGYPRNGNMDPGLFVKRSRRLTTRVSTSLRVQENSGYDGTTRAKAGRHLGIYSAAAKEFQSLELQIEGLGGRKPNVTSIHSSIVSERNMGGVRSIFVLSKYVSKHLSLRKPG